MSQIFIFVHFLHRIRFCQVYFTDFMRDDEYDDDGLIVTEAPKIYEIGGRLPDLRLRVDVFISRYNDQFPSRQLNIVLFDDF